jgi:hypothetical protein
MKKIMVSVLLSLLVSILLLGACSPAQVAPPVEAEKQVEAPAAAVQIAEPTPTLVPRISTQFTALLNPDEWAKETLGASALEGGYVVDITPLTPSVNGASIEHQILPEFDGEKWNDTLWMKLSNETTPQKVRVQVFSTIDWPVAFEGVIDLKPGEVHDFVIQDASNMAGYVVEVDPLKAGIAGDTFEQALVLPKFTGDWYDVLRIQIPESQPALSANVRVYRTPDDLPVQAEFDVHLEPDDWVGFVMGEAKDRCVFLIEINPLVDEEIQIERFQVQPEYDGKDWKDIAHLKISAESPATDVRIRIYTIR